MPEYEPFPPENVDPETGEVTGPETGLVPVGDQSPEVLPRSPAEMSQRLGAMLSDAKSRAMEDPEEISRSIVERILKAETFEDVFAPQAVRHARELLDVPLVVHGIRFNQSDFEAGFGFYCLVDCTDAETGESVVVSVGGRNVMAQLFRADQLGVFPAKLKFTQPARPTRQGYWPLWLTPAT